MVALSTRDELRTLAEQAGRDLEGASAVEILTWADEQFGSGWAVASSMADAVVPSLAAKVRPGVDILFLDTGYHFAETIGTRDAVGATLPVNIRTVSPRQTVEQQDASFGARLYERNPDQCCALRKVMPLRAALKDYVAWASGLRRDEADTRKDVKVVEWDAGRSMVKLNPIAAWTQDDVDRYIEENGILVNPLLFDGYGSIGWWAWTRGTQPAGEGRGGAR